MELYDITIVGGGPAGMYAAFYCGMREMKTKLIEAKSELGGFLHMYPEKTVWDVGGIPPIRCDKLIAMLAGQAKTFNPDIAFNQKVVGLTPLADGTFLLESEAGERHWTRTVLLAMGRGITSMNKLPISGADRFEITNLYYTIQDLNSFRGKRVLVSGGGNSAVDWANELAAVADEVTIVHRKTQFSALEWNITEMYKSVRVLTPYRLRMLHGGGDAIETAEIEHEATGETELLSVDAVVVNHGYQRDYGALAEWGLTIVPDEGLLVDERGRTNVPGLFAAGDCVTYGSKVLLMAGAFNDAVLAVNSAKVHLEPEASAMAYVSSHNYRFAELNKKRRAVDSS